MKDGVYKCTLHKVPCLYQRRCDLRRHLYFCHRGDDIDFLCQNGIDPQRIEMLCKECKGTSWEYSVTREDYWQFCLKHDKEETEFAKFLTLNAFYEARYIEEQFILGADLAAEYKKQCEGDKEWDDDDY